MLSPLWPPPSPSIWDCGQIGLPCWPQLYPTMVSVCSYKFQKKCREKRRSCAVSVEHPALQPASLLGSCGTAPKRFLGREATSVVNHCAWGCWKSKEREKGITLPCLLFSGWLHSWGENYGLQREVSPLNYPILLTEDFKPWTLPMHVGVNGTHGDTLMFYMQSLTLLNKLFSI